MESTDFEKRLKELKRRYGIFSNAIASQLSSAREAKGVFEARSLQFKEQLDGHYMELIDRVMLNKKHFVEMEADTVLKHFDERLSQAMNEAHEIKVRLNELIEKYQKIVDDPCYTPSNPQYKNADDDFNDEDALMINESIEEFDLNNNESTTNNSELMRLERSIDGLLGQKVLLSELINEISSKQDTYYNDLIRLNPCINDLEGICLGHLEVGCGQLDTYESIAKGFPGLDLIDHSRFKFETDLTAKFLYNLNEKIKIDFSCPYFSTPERQVTYAKNFHEKLLVKAYDPFKNEVKVLISEKIESTRHTLRLTFDARENPGIYEISVQFKNAHIPGSPFHVAIVDKGFNNAQPCQSTNKVYANSNEALEINASSRSSISSMGQIDSAPTYTTGSILPACPSRDANFGQNGVVSAGRGRVINKLRMKNMQSTSNEDSTTLPSRCSNNIQLTMFPSQKRTMSYENGGSNSNYEHMDAEDMEGELSSKLQKLVTVDERNKETAVRESTNVERNMTVNVASAHLRKFAHLANRAVDRQIPPLKAEFVRKFSADFKFPIGVRPYAFRNWLIVCDSGTDSIKILDGNSGKLLSQIASESKETYTLKRPSAILIDNENQSDIYVKDDKEILVFDMSDNFRFIKKFGFGILHKPYGLAYDNQYNLVVVDADFRHPRIHVFNKSNGTLIKSKQYEPILSQCSNSSTLAELYSPSGILCHGVAPMEKSKVRFIDCQNDALFASDLGRSVIFKTNLDGEIEMAFGHHGKRPGELNEPSGIHVERDGGAVLVGDSRNDRIQVYGPDGRYKCDIEFKEKIVRPSDIYVDDFGFLYVTCFIQHCIKKYKLVSD